MQQTTDIDIADILLRGEAVRQFQVQMILQKPHIAAAQPLDLLIRLGLAPLPKDEYDYFVRTAAAHAT